MEYIAKAAVITVNNKLRGLINTQLREQQRIYGVWGRLIYCEPYCPTLGTSGKMGAIICDSDCIDCGCYTPNGTEEEAVRLFLTLAEMREGVDTNSFVQWNDSIYLPNLPAIPAILKGSITKIMTMIGCDGKLYHRLSPLEVAQAYKDGRIKL